MNGLLTEDEGDPVETQSKRLKRKKHIFLHLQRPFVILDIKHSNIIHSCAPNAVFEASSANDPTNLGPLQYQLSALHNISPGDKLTVSRLDDLTCNELIRQKCLHRMFGKNFECNCPRCICERNWYRRDAFVVTSSHHDELIHPKLCFKNDDLKRLGDLAMQQERYQDAQDLYSVLLKFEPFNGDVLHARCASHLARGDFLLAHALWEDASKLAPNHEGIQLHLIKYSTYNKGKKNYEESAASLIQYQTFIPCKCFVTDDQTPILDRDECARIIQITEDEAVKRRDGWTTSRHYAVPTTDIPIHEIPSLLPIFNTLMNKVHPLLHRQFGDAIAGNIYIHDAFVVKYNAEMGQQHLPLHRDESTHSFVIALNDTLEYDGGGTYIARLNRSLRPRIGGMISFRGDELLHGGDPVVSGVRYIIVAFCYVSTAVDIMDSNETPPLPLSKKRKDDRNVFERSTGDVPTTAFSFNFIV